MNFAGLDMKNIKLSRCGLRRRSTSAQSCSFMTTRWSIKDSEVVVLEHLKSSPCGRRALFCITSVPLFLSVRRGSGNVTSMNPKNGLRHTLRHYQAPPDVKKFYVNILVCLYDSSFRALSKVGNTSGCQVLLSQLLEWLVVSVKHTCLMQLKISEIKLCIYLTVHKKWIKNIKEWKYKNTTCLLCSRSRVNQTDSAAPIF